MQTPSPLQLICLEHLDRLKMSTEHLRLAVIASVDGFPIAQIINPDPLAGRKAAAMASALGGLASSVVSEFALGALEGVVLECDQGLVLCRQIPRAKKNLILMIIFDDEVTYGHALWAIKRSVKSISVSLSNLSDTNTTL